jgi:DNA polymerase-3 subunit delta'
VAQEVGGPLERRRRQGRSVIDILAAAEKIAKAQGRAWPLLEGLVSSGKLPGALIFAGPEGAGKELMAVKLAALLNCDSVAAVPRGGRGAACAAPARCPACARIRSLEHPDVHLMYPVPHGEMDKELPGVLESRREDFFNYGESGSRARSIGIDMIRHVTDVLSKHPFEGRRTIVAVFEAHLATAEAQNALLKLLEEPPPSAAIVLVTEYPDRLLPTVLSRCYEIRFDPLPAEAIAEFLVEFYSVEALEARRLAALAQGNLRRGIKLLEERFLSLWKNGAEAAKLVVDGNGKGLLAEAEALSMRYTREEIVELLEEMIIIFGLLIRNRDGRLGDAERGVLGETLGEARLASSAERNLTDDIRKISSSIESLRRNADAELTLSQVFLDLTGTWY